MEQHSFASICLIHKFQKTMVLIDTSWMLEKLVGFETFKFFIWQFFSTSRDNICQFRELSISFHLPLFWELERFFFFFLELEVKTKSDLWEKKSNIHAATLIADHWSPVWSYICNSIILCPVLHARTYFTWYRSVSNYRTSSVICRPVMHRDVSRLFKIESPYRRAGARLLPPNLRYPQTRVWVV